MQCPKCGGKTKVVDGINNYDEHERYRRRDCLSCGHVFYTTEFEVEYDEDFIDRWHYYHRVYIKRREEHNK